MFRDLPQMLEDRPQPIELSYRRLWAAVINQAEDDLKGVPDWHDKNSIHYKTLRREAAQAWFRSAETGLGSFHWICDNLNIDPDGIRQRILVRHSHEKHLESKAPAKALGRRFPMPAV